MSTEDTNILEPGAADSVWRGAVDWEFSASGCTPWRLDRQSGTSRIGAELAEVAKAGAGVRAEINTDARRALLVVERPDDETGCVDLVVDGVLRDRARVSRGVQSIWFELDAVSSRVELWLPQAGITRVRSLELTGANRVAPSSSLRPKWVVYGSSITQCFEARGPTDTWPARIARSLGWDLMSMGFSGQCFLDRVAAETVAESSADIVTVCAGINIYNRGEWNQDELRARLAAFLDTIRAGLAHTPVVVMSPLASASRESARNDAGMTLVDVRAVIAAAALQRRSSGVHYVDGTRILGHADQALLHDGLHPSANGYALMAARIAPRLRRIARRASLAVDPEFDQHRD